MWGAGGFPGILHCDEEGFLFGIGFYEKII